MDFRREYLGRWEDDSIMHSQRHVLGECRVLEDSRRLFDLWLDHSFVREFRSIRIRGEWEASDFIPINDEVWLELWLCIDGLQIPNHYMRCQLRQDESLLHYHPRPMPLPTFDFPIENVEARHSIQICAHLLDRGTVILRNLLLEVKYVVPEVELPSPLDGYTYLNSSLDPSLTSVFTPYPLQIGPDGYGSASIYWEGEQEYLAQHIYSSLGVPNEYISGVPKEELPQKHKGFYVEEENQNRKDCLYCGEPLKRIDFYMICEECDHV